MRKRSETIAPIAAQPLQLFARSDFSTLTVGSYARSRVAHIGDWNKRGDALRERCLAKRLDGWKAAAPCYRSAKLRFVCHNKIEAHVHIEAKSWLLSFQLRHSLL